MPGVEDGPTAGCIIGVLLARKCNRRILNEHKQKSITVRFPFLCRRALYVSILLGFRLCIGCKACARVEVAAVAAAREFILK